MSTLTYDRLATLAPILRFLAPPGVSPEGYGGLVISGNTLAWRTEWEDGPEVLLIDLAIGALVHREQNLAGKRMFCVDEGFLIEDNGYRLDGAKKKSKEARRLVFLSRDGKTNQTFAAPPGIIRSFSPDRREVASFHEGRLEIRLWPSLSLAFAQTGFKPGVDWDVRRTFCYDGKQYVALAIDGNCPPHSINTGSETLYAMGQGIAQSGIGGLTLYSLLSNWQLTIAPPGEGGYVPSGLTKDGRGICIVLGERPRRFDIDFAAGRLLSEPAFDLHPRDDEAWWHPELDAVLFKRSGRLLLSTLDGRRLCRLPIGARPECWFDQGCALLVTYPSADPDRLQMEVWRVSYLH